MSLVYKSISLVQEDELTEASLLSAPLQGEGGQGGGYTVGRSNKGTRGRRTEPGHRLSLTCCVSTIKLQTSMCFGFFFKEGKHVIRRDDYSYSILNKYTTFYTLFMTQQGIYICIYIYFFVK